MNEPHDDENLFRDRESGFESWVNDAGGEQEFKRGLLERFHVRRKRARVFRLRRIAAIAASVVVVFSLGLYLSGTFKEAIAPAGKPIGAARKKPGNERAVLVLANGTQIDVSDLADGLLVQQDDERIHKQGGSLIFSTDSPRTSRAAPVAFNTVVTPRGGKFRIVLADGSIVFMNAASKLRFPAVFRSKTRDVELSGEAYFEVVHNPARPFNVGTGTQTVTVLGTHFNIKAYQNEQQISTTLLEGSVLVTDKATGAHRVLKPGEQSLVSRSVKRPITVNAVEKDQALAWKEGYFDFDDQDIATVINEIGRWYDMDVEIRTKQSTRIGGTFSKTTNLDALLRNLEKIGNIRLTVKERRIIASD